MTGGGGGVLELLFIYILVLAKFSAVYVCGRGGVCVCVWGGGGGGGGVCAINQYFMSVHIEVILDKNKNIIIIYTNFPTGLWTIDLTMLVITSLSYKISLTLL